MKREDRDNFMNRLKGERVLYIISKNHFSTEQEP
jgi:hypothetical protein